MEIEMIGRAMRDYIKRAIAPVLDKYDFILLDCPPQLGLLTMCLACSDYVVIPVKPIIWPIEAWNFLWKALQR